jgi:hypothetical protein
LSTRQAMCVERNTEVHSHNHNCRGKATSITYSEYVCVALLIQHTKHMYHMLSVAYFPHYLINSTVFGEKLLNIKMLLLIFSTTFF